MKTCFPKLTVVAVLLALLSTLNLQLLTLHAQGTAFTYQGRLNDGGVPANGSYDLRFKLFVDPLGNNQVGSPVLTNGMPVTNGLFMMVLDFGAGSFTGSNYWLEVGVKANGGAAYTDLSPLQPITPTPYAIFAENIGSGGLPAGTYGSAVTFNNAANSFSGSFTGNGAGVTNVNAATIAGLGASNFWQTTGNSGTSPTNGNFLGTLDVQPVELRVGGLRALRLEPDPRAVPEAANLIGGFTNNVIQQPGSGGDVIVGGGYDAGVNVIHSNSAGIFMGAGSANQVGPNVNDAVIAGGFGNNIGGDGYRSVIGGGNDNTNNEFDSVIGGGQNNLIQTTADHAFIGGGQNNTIQTASPYSGIGGGLFNKIQSANDAFIGGGYINAIGTNAGTAFIGGGYNNTIGQDGGSGGGNGSVIGGGSQNAIYEFDSFIGGGQQNLIQPDADHSVIGGGYSNVITGSLLPPLVTGVIGGGQNNLIQTNSFSSVIGGGYGNTIQSNAFYAVVPGGSGNVAGGTNSFAAGTSAQATNNGAFVWSDNSTTNPFSSTTANQFAVRATGGIQLVTGSGTGLTINGGTTTFNTGAASLAIVNENSLVPGIAASSSFYNGHMRFRNALEIWPDTGGTNGGYLDVRNLSGTQTIWMSGTNGNITCTSLSQTSDRNAKQDFAPVSSTQMLDKVARLPISEWSYKTDSAARHIGPVAQDFYSIFNIGMDDKHIAPIDEGGVALAAIQGLNQKVEMENAALRAENADLKARLDKLQQLITSMKGDNK